MKVLARLRSDAASLHRVRVLVTGGTGFIGRRLVQALLSRGDAVTVVSRAPAAASDPGGPSTTSWADDDLARAVAGADGVVHLAGENIAERRWSPERLAALRSSRVDTAASLVRAIGRSEARPRVLVGGSGIGVYGLRKDDAELDESSPHGDDFLARLCDEWEAAAERAQGHGVRVACARTGIVLAPEGGVLGKMLPVFRAFIGGALGDGQQWLPWIHMDDAVRALLFALDHAPLDGPFNLVAPEPVRMGEFAREVGAVLRRPSLMSVPAFALRLALGEGLAEAVLTGQRATPRRLLSLGFEFRFPRLDGALRDLLT